MTNGNEHRRLSHSGYILCIGSLVELCTPKGALVLWYSLLCSTSKRLPVRMYIGTPNSSHAPDSLTVASRVVLTVFGTYEFDMELCVSTRSHVRLLLRSCQSCFLFGVGLTLSNGSGPKRTKV